MYKMYVMCVHVCACVCVYTHTHTAIQNIFYVAFLCNLLCKSEFSSAFMPVL